ncbi:ATP-grasp domain-containing protein [Pseudomonas edaphica]|uniref:ATP-grasp domain-containing protein n=1 Tax=Pseudomonas edaphica TaxID=2006980 RepID=A0A7Y7RP64_9PSED|nr:ATP-grasp domain-containing protein [Pseudomonas edaphica]NVZ55867.1 ATP-grasp domain-containing protein [Pseudomonas edaphica]
MKPRTIIVIENLIIRLPNLHAIAAAATQAGVTMIAIVPDVLSPDEIDALPFRTVPIRDWSSAGLETMVCSLERHAAVVGIGTCIGFFTPEGLLGAQVAELCARRGLTHPPIEALYLANNKFAMRQRLRERNVYTARYARVIGDASLVTAAEHVGFPLILKPVVGMGSSFISRCENIADMRRVFRHYQAHARDGYYTEYFCAHGIGDEHFEPMREMLAEEAIDGYEISVECLCTENQILPLLMHDKLDVEQSSYSAYENLLVTPPIRLTPNEQQQILIYTRVVLNTLGLRNCVCHVELRYDSKGRASIIEVNPRVGGMRVKESLLALRGVDFAAMYVQQLLGKPFNFPEPPTTSGYYAMSAVYPRVSGILKGIRGTEAARQLPGVLSVSTHIAPGTSIGGDFEEVFAVDAWLQAETPDAIKALDQRIRELIKVDIG